MSKLNKINSAKGVKKTGKAKSVKMKPVEAKPAASPAAKPVNVVFANGLERNAVALVAETMPQMRDAVGKDAAASGRDRILAMPAAETIKVFETVLALANGFNALFEQAITRVDWKDERICAADAALAGVPADDALSDARTALRRALDFSAEFAFYVGNALFKWRHCVDLTKGIIALLAAPEGREDAAAVNTRRDAIARLLAACEAAEANDGIECVAAEGQDGYPVPLDAKRKAAKPRNNRTKTRKAKTRL